MKAVKKQASHKASRKVRSAASTLSLVREEQVQYGGPKPLTTRRAVKLEKIVSVGAQSPIKYHIIISIDKKNWRVVPENKLSSIRNFPQKQAAIDFVKKMNKPVEEIVVHSEQGEVVQRIK
jgi:hypothetical protein